MCSRVILLLLEKLELFFPEIAKRLLLGLMLKLKVTMHERAAQSFSVVAQLKKRIALFFYFLLLSGSQSMYQL